MSRAFALMTLVWAMPALAESPPATPSVEPPPPIPAVVARVTVAGPGEHAPPEVSAVALRGAWVPDSGGASLTFVDVVGDVVFGGAASLHAVRAALQWIRTAVAVEDRSADHLGNLRLEYWNTGRWSDEQGDGRFYRSSFAVGLSFPTDDGPAVGRAYEQREEISVPGYALWGTWQGGWSTDRWALTVLGTLGLTTQEGAFFGLAPVGHLDVTGAWSFADGLAATLSVVVPGQVVLPNPTLLPGLRWRPLEHFELAAGVHLVPGAADYVDLSPVRPVAEVRGRF